MILNDGCEEEFQFVVQDKICFGNYLSDMIVKSYVIYRYYSSLLWFEFFLIN